MSYKIYSWHGNPRGNMVRIAAEYAEVDYEFVNVQKSELKQEKFLNVHSLGKVPVVEGPEGKIFETGAILNFFARKVAKKNLLGKTVFEQAQTQQWMNLISDLPIFEVFPAIFFLEELNEAQKQQLAAGKKDLLGKLQHINDHLNLNTYLVGNQVTVADIVLACLLHPFFSTILDENYRKGHLALTRYYKTILGQPEFRKFYPQAHMVKKDWFASVKGEEQKQEQKPKKEKQQPKKEEKKVEKKEEAPPQKAKNPLDELPPSPFNLFDFKTFIVNEKDKQKGVEEFWKQFDPQGYSIWHIKYDRYEGEGEKLYLTSNLKDSFLQRCDQLRKHAFGTFGVYGDEGNYEIEGVWVWRGQEIPQELKDLPMYDYYFWNKLDHTKSEDRALLEEFWTNMEEDKSKVKGMVARDVGYYK
ncbi:Translation elongation factor EF1B, gamma chain, conserved [Pseudocohnilembus persalinus]|uniref:Translation elongation factor EF1B, gamma chain, conserved n=1 Tax=Pseudocohnilembus persalinus TaxID=266149 RepID=A0A0V0QQX6_PSEPJ|nr:Translation elongation factor EF1B, gamma chain, conserved [Pseudocohnilembus persalinus]|eukprot:KRX04442.1 Translation elongation factor EF1B, gamma chain, conserved [Pseudocohnilembus persalinus]